MVNNIKSSLFADSAELNAKSDQRHYDRNLTFNRSVLVCTLKRRGVVGHRFLVAEQEIQSFGGSLELIFACTFHY